MPSAYKSVGSNIHDCLAPAGTMYVERVSLTACRADKMLR